MRTCNRGLLLAVLVLVTLLMGVASPVRASLVPLEGDAQTLAPMSTAPAPLAEVISSRYTTIRCYGISPDRTLAVVYGLKKNAKHATVEIYNTTSGAWIWEIEPQHFDWKEDGVSVAIDNDGIVWGLFYSQLENVSRFHQMYWNGEQHRVIHSEFGIIRGKAIFIRRGVGKHAPIAESRFH